MIRYFVFVLALLICGAANAQVPVILTSPSTSGGTTTPAVIGTATNPLFVSGNSLTSPAAAGGRLTLSTTLPVLTADVLNATTVSYLPYVSQKVPVYNGTAWTAQDIGATGISLTLNTTNMPTTEVFDVYASLQSGTPALCAMYWGGNTARSTTAGGKTGTANASIVQLNGIWTNNVAIATGDCFNNTTSMVIAQNQGTYLGSFFTTAAGQTGIQCQPANAAGGPTGGGFIDVFNAYNRVPITCEEQDQSTWTYATATVRQADGSVKNQINFLDGLRQIGVYATYTVNTANSTIADECAIYVDLDSTSSVGKQPGITTSPTSTLADNWTTITANAYWYPQLGLHFVAPVEFASAGTCSFNFFGNASQTGMIFALPWQF